MESLNRGELRSRYVISGQLVAETALHIGGGRESTTATASPVVRTPDGDPYIPGSSFKGAFRAAVERLAPLLDLNTCQLRPGYPDCLSTNETLAGHYQTLREGIGRPLRDDAATREALEALGIESWLDENGLLTEERLLKVLDAKLCETCKTFGSVHLASPVHVHDLHVDGDWSGIYQIRDGVGIDRDSERARDQIKFDYEVVPPQTVFAFQMTVESPRERDLGLVSVGLQEFVQGMVPLGGIRSRGLGRCRLADLQVRSVDFNDYDQRVQYLVSGAMVEESGAAFLQAQIKALLKGEVTDA